MSLPYKKIAVYFTDINELDQRWPGIMTVAQECKAELRLFRGVTKNVVDQELLFSEMKILQERLLATHLPFELRYIGGETMKELCAHAAAAGVDLIWTPEGRIVVNESNQVAMAS